jgi:hypothetical protein
VSETRVGHSELVDSRGDTGLLVLLEGCMTIRNQMRHQNQTERMRGRHLFLRPIFEQWRRPDGGDPQDARKWADVNLVARCDPRFVKRRL